MSIKMCTSALRLSIQLIFLSASSFTLTPRPLLFVHVIKTPDGDLIVEKGLIFNHEIRLVVTHISFIPYSDKQGNGAKYSQCCNSFRGAVAFQ